MALIRIFLCLAWMLNIMRFDVPFHPHVISTPSPPLAEAASYAAAKPYIFKIARQMNTREKPQSPLEDSPPQFNQNSLHRKLSPPLLQTRQLRRINLISQSAQPLHGMRHQHPFPTFPFFASTHGRLILEMNVTSGGASG